eukprot:6800448-Pyramimonas_sp.AAC.1
MSSYADHLRLQLELARTLLRAKRARGSSAYKCHSTPQMRIRMRGRWGRRQSAKLRRSPPQAPKFHNVYNQPAAGFDFLG